LPGRPAKVEVWLLQYGDFKIREPLLVGGDAVPAADNGLHSQIAYRSSITQRRTAVGPSETYPPWSHGNTAGSSPTWAWAPTAISARSSPAPSDVRRQS
jgi:hypothetical protein